MDNQKGFTLIELVMVIVILGILAATALPKFVDITGDARNAAVQGIAGALGSASAINKSARLANITHGISIQDCSAAGSLLDGGLDTNKYSLNTLSTTAGNFVACTVSDKAVTTSTASFTLYSVT